MENPNKIKVSANFSHLEVPCDKLTQRVFDLSDQDLIDVQSGKWLGVIENPNAEEKKQVTTFFLLQPVEGYEITEKFSVLDWFVLAACATVYKNGRTAATLNQICGMLTGRTDRRPSKSLKEAVLVSIRKLMRTEITVNIGKKSCRFYRHFMGAVKLTDVILPCRIFEGIANGQQTCIIEFRDESPLLELAQAKNQLLTIETNYLDVRGMHNTPKIVTLKSYVSYRVTAIIRGRLNNPCIGLADLYDKSCGLGAPKAEKQRTRAFIKKIFEDLVADGVIEKFQFVKGRGKEKSKLLQNGGNEFWNVKIFW